MGCTHTPPPPEMTFGFLIDLHSNTRSAVLFAMYCQQFTLSYWLAISLLLRCLLSKSLYVTRQLCHSMVVHPLRKMSRFAPTGWLTNTQTTWHADWVTCCLPDWMTARLFDWLAIWKPDLDRKTDKQTGWLTDRERQTDWLTNWQPAYLPA